MFELNDRVGGRLDPTRGERVGDVEGEFVGLGMTARLGAAVCGVLGGLSVPLANGVWE